MTKKILFLNILLFCCISTYAINYRFRHINSENGLPHQQVEALVQDGKGNIWMGTRNGLSRYDGYEIKTYYHDDAIPTSLCHNFVKSLYLDKKKRIWICTEKGICRYRPESDDFIRYKSISREVSILTETNLGKIVCGGDQLYMYDEEKDEFTPYPSLSNDFILSIAVDKNDNMYVSTSRSIFFYNSSLTQITRLNPKYYSDFVTGSDDIIPMRFDSRGYLWISKNGKGVLRLNPKTGESLVYSPEELSDGTVRVITEDCSHRIWLGTEKGITIINPNGTIEILRHKFQDLNQLSDNAIYAIICDANQNMWIGSYFGGVDVILNSYKQFTWHEPGYAPQNIKGKVPRMMVESSPGVFWIATEDGGINIYNSANNTFSVFNAIPSIGTNVHSLYHDKTSSEMWIGTFRQGLFRYNTKTGQYVRYLFTNGLSSNSIFAFAKQRNGRLWVATTLGLRYYDPKTDQFLKVGNAELDNYFIYTLCVDKDDNVWVGTLYHGLFKIDAKTGKVRYWKKAQHNSNLGDDYITCLFQDSHGRLWIGTNNYGLRYLDVKTGKISSLDNDFFLSRCTVCSINEDTSGHLWIGTSVGLYKYQSSTNSWLRFTTEDGLPTNQFNFSSSLFSSSGRMYLGTVDGLINFNPKALKGKNSDIIVHLKNLIIGNSLITASTSNSPLSTELDEASSITLSYDQARSFTIEYGVIMPGNTSSVEYQVMFEGVDKDWRDVGTERKFTGFNLPQGTYYLHVRANNTNGGWDKCKEKIIKITVEPPFYYSGWAFLIYLLIIGGIGYFAYRMFSIRMRERNAVRMANMEKEKIKEIDLEKFNFFTTVSHELKTPLSLIVAPLKTLMREKLTPEQHYNLDIAVKHTRKMEGLINELVTFNKLETNNFPFYIQKGNPLQFLDLIVMSFKETAQEKQLKFTINLENNGEEVWFSPTYVEHIINNLLSNAFKFTSNGGSVMVNAKITTLPDSNFVYLGIEVADTGIGIAKEELNSIFKNYYQTKRGYNVNGSGWGIGLSLVKRLAEIHKGKVEVESKIQEGSTFKVWLNVSNSAFSENCCINDDKVIVPLNEYKSGSMIDLDAEYKGNEPEAEDNELSILIVDDNDDLLSYLHNYFATKYNVFTAKNGEDALAIANKNQLQLIVSDVMMPGMDGYELCSKLKSDVNTSHIPVVLLTAKSGQEDVVTGYKSGAEAYVSKPFDPEILELQINNIIQLQKVRQTEIINASVQDIDTTYLSEIDKNFLQSINSLIDENIGNSDFAIVDITQNLCISRSLLHVKMKSLVNMSMGDYLRKKRIDKACELLNQGDNVSETAYKTGFADPNYFSKTFKKYVGISPTEYMKKKNNK